MIISRPDIDAWIITAEKNDNQEKVCKLMSDFYNQLIEKIIGETLHPENLLLFSQADTQVTNITLNVH